MRSTSAGARWSRRIAALTVAAALPMGTAWGADEVIPMRGGDIRVPHFAPSEHKDAASCQIALNAAYNALADQLGSIPFPPPGEPGYHELANAIGEQMDAISALRPQCLALGAASTDTAALLPPTDSGSCPPGVLCGRVSVTASGSPASRSEPTPEDGSPSPETSALTAEEEARLDELAAALPKDSPIRQARGRGASWAAIAVAFGLVVVALLWMAFKPDLRDPLTYTSLGKLRRLSKTSGVHPHTGKPMPTRRTAQPGGMSVGGPSPGRDPLPRKDSAPLKGPDGSESAADKAMKDAYSAQKNPSPEARKQARNMHGPREPFRTDTDKPKD